MFRKFLCWESPGDLPLVIEMFVSFRSFRSAPLAKRHKISITRGRSPGLSQERMYEPIILLFPKNTTTESFKGALTHDVLLDTYPHRIK
jgi:hypothetical protein